MTPPAGLEVNFPVVNVIERLLEENWTETTSLRNVQSISNKQF